MVHSIITFHGINQSYKIYNTHTFIDGGFQTRGR